MTPRVIPAVKVGPSLRTEKGKHREGTSTAMMFSDEVECVSCLPRHRLEGDAYRPGTLQRR